MKALIGVSSPRPGASPGRGVPGGPGWIPPGLGFPVFAGLVGILLTFALWVLTGDPVYFVYLGVVGALVVVIGVSIWRTSTRSQRRLDALESARRAREVAAWLERLRAEAAQAVEREREYLEQVRRQRTTVTPSVVPEASPAPPAALAAEPYDPAVDPRTVVIGIVDEGEAVTR